MGVDVHIKVLSKLKSAAVDGMCIDIVAIWI